MNFRARMLDTITYAAPNGVGAAGDLTFGSTATTAARIDYKASIVTAPNGEQVACSTIIVTEIEIVPDSRVWMPGVSATANLAKRVIATEHAKTLDGSYELYYAYL